MVGRKRLLVFILLLFCVSFSFIALLHNRSDIYPQNLQTFALWKSFVTNFSEKGKEISTGVGLAQTDETCASGRLYYEKYCVISPYEETLKYTRAAGNVTLCTQSTVEFLHHAAVLCHRWAGPISVAIYCPGEDYDLARQTVHSLRECDSCIKYWVSWHFIVDKDDKPSEDKCFLPSCEGILLNEKPRRRRSEGSYPINVARNVARKQAKTPFVFSIDIELYPSIGILPKFERMIKFWTSGFDNQVWAFPVFEVYIQQPAPLTKHQLRRMFLQKQAISFHQYRCNMCHRIPNLTQWMRSEVDDSESEDSLQPLKIWSTVKRNKRFRLPYWEPFFIGTDKDPEFDIKLSWEGKQNKMQMAYEMCMRNYDFHIVQNAFLVHAPGINKYNASRERERNKYIPVNQRVMQKVKKDLKIKYGNVDC